MQTRSVRRLSGAIDAILRMSGTRANYWAEFVVDIPLGAMFMSEGLRRRDIPLASAFFSILLGLFCFSLIEYSVHRWLFHGSVRVFVQGHRAHHENPTGYDALPFFLPGSVLLVLAGLLNLLMPTTHAFLLSGAAAAGYVAYGLSHFTIHHHRFHNPLARRWAANHHIHHYHATVNFGITTPLWDNVLGTRYQRA